MHVPFYSNFKSDTFVLKIFVRIHELSAVLQSKQILKWYVMSISQPCVCIKLCP